MPNTPKRVTGIYGSPRQDGNNDTLMNAAMEGAASAGAHVERLYLRDLQFSACLNCGHCTTHGVCRLNDDMGAVYAALDSSDVIVLGSPVYFCSLCAQAKAMVDRCQPYWARKYVLKQEPPNVSRVGGFVCCGGFKDDRFLPCTEQIVKTWYFIMRIGFHGSFFVPGLDGREDAMRHPTARTGAFEYGKALVHSHG